MLIILEIMVHLLYFQTQLSGHLFDPLKMTINKKENRFHDLYFIGS